MSTAGLRVFDADAHVIEPEDLYFEYLDPAFRDRVTVDESIGRHHGKLLPRLDGRQSSGGSAWMHEYMRTGGAEQVLVDRFGDTAERGFRADAMIAGFDRPGVERAALYPSFSPHVPYTATAAPE